MGSRIHEDCHGRAGDDVRRKRVSSWLRRARRGDRRRERSRVARRLSAFEAYQEAQKRRGAAGAGWRWLFAREYLDVVRPRTSFIRIEVAT